LLAESGPETILHDLAVGLMNEPDPLVIGVHFFPFGGVARTGDFIATTLGRLYQDIASAASA
jgi:hypothetical protein